MSKSPLYFPRQSYSCARSRPGGHVAQRARFLRLVYSFTGFSYPSERSVSGIFLWPAQRTSCATSSPPPNDATRAHERCKREFPSLLHCGLRDFATNGMSPSSVLRYLMPPQEHTTYVAKLRSVSMRSIKLTYEIVSLLLNLIVQKISDYKLWTKAHSCQIKGLKVSFLKQS